jgi:hypothetical protein
MHKVDKAVILDYQQPAIMTYERLKTFRTFADARLGEMLRAAYKVGFEQAAVNFAKKPGSDEFLALQDAAMCWQHVRFTMDSPS